MWLRCHTYTIHSQNSRSIPPGTGFRVAVQHQSTPHTNSHPANAVVSTCVLATAHAALGGAGDANSAEGLQWKTECRLALRRHSESRTPHERSPPAEFRITQPRQLRTESRPREHQPCSGRRCMCVWQQGRCSRPNKARRCRRFSAGRQALVEQSVANTWPNQAADKSKPFITLSPLLLCAGNFAGAPLHAVARYSQCLPARSRSTWGIRQLASAPPLSSVRNSGCCSRGSPRRQRQPAGCAPTVLGC